MGRLFLLGAILVGVSGCGTTYHIVPEIEGAGAGLAVPVFTGSVDYSGNPDYLPRTIRCSGDESGKIGFKYQYNVGYGKDAVPEALPLFNPLTLVGFPIGADSLVVVGSLDVVKGREVVKTYSSTCVIDKTRSIFYEGKTHSELRREGLFKVRENIELQMLKDQEILSGLQQ